MLRFWYRDKFQSKILGQSITNGCFPIGLLKGGKEEGKTEQLESKFWLKNSKKTEKMNEFKIII